MKVRYVRDFTRSYIVQKKTKRKRKPSMYIFPRHVAQFITGNRSPKSRSMLGLLPSPANSLDEILLGDLLAAREIPSSDLGVDLHSGVRGNKVVCRSKLETPRKSLVG